MKQPAMNPAPIPLHSAIEARFGLVPAMFRVVPDAPEIHANLWEFARAAYLDNPLPSLFKERLFVLLSLFSGVRYCLALHVAFLVAGRASGYRTCPAESVEQVVRLVGTPLPSRDPLEPHLAVLERSPPGEVPGPDTPAEQALFACAAQVFLRTSQAPSALAALRRALGHPGVEHLGLFLSFVRVAHDWSRMHPEVEVEEVARELLATHPSLAARLEARADDPERTDATLLDAIVENIPASIFVKEVTNLSFVRLNRGNEELTGLPRQAVIGRTDHELFPEESVFFQEKDREALAAGQVVDIPEEPLHTTRRVRWLHTRKVTIRDSSGRPTHLLGMSIDITEAKRVREELVEARLLLERRVEERTAELRREIVDRTRTEDALRASEERFRLAAEAVEGIIYEIDCATGRVERSCGLLQVLGYDAAAVPPTCAWWVEQVHPDDRQWMDELFRHPEEWPDGRVRVEYQVRHQDGRWVYVQEGALVRMDERGLPIRVIGSLVDVSARIDALEALKASQANVRESEALFRTLGEAVGDLLWMADVNGKVIYRNPAWYTYSGLSPAELGHDGWRKLLHPDDLEPLREARARSLGNGLPFELELRCRRADGQYRWFRLRTVPVRDGEGWVGTTTDIHDLRQAEEALKDAGRRKDEFLATLAHELRNPLAPIRTGLRLIQRAEGDWATVEQARGIMERQVGHMVVLIDDLLDVSRITRGKMVLHRGLIDVAEVIRHGVEAVSPLIDQYGHELTVAIPPAPIVLDGDLTRLAQVVGNLLTNAAKYTPAGGKIRLSAEPRGDHVAITVSDTGIGIPPASLGGVFELFSQVDRSLEKATGGLGIGLALVRGLVEMHGGTVTAHSEGEGHGSTFTVRLPVAHLPAPVWTEAPTPPPSVHRRILVVDDNVDGAHSLALLVSLAGNDVRTAYDGLEAVELASVFRPELILMDVAMPRLNGLDATRRIREQPWGRSIHIVALTGWGQDSDRARSTAAGCDEHLVKPVDPRTIEELLARLPA